MNEPQKNKLPNPFNDLERQHIEAALDMAQRSYKRSQNQRPEFAEVAKKLENEIGDIIRKIRTL